MAELQAQFGASNNEEIKDKPEWEQPYVEPSNGYEADDIMLDASAFGMTEAEIAQQRQMMESFQTTGQGMIGPQLPANFQIMKSEKKGGSDAGSLDQNLSDGEVKEKPQQIVSEI